MSGIDKIMFDLNGASSASVEKHITNILSVCSKAFEELSSEESALFVFICKFIFESISEDINDIVVHGKSHKEVKFLRTITGGQDKGAPFENPS